MKNREKKERDGVTLAFMRHRLYSYERTRCRRAKLRTDSGYTGGLLLTEPPYWYRIPSTFCDPSVLVARSAAFTDKLPRAPLPALRDLSPFLSFFPIILPPSLFSPLPRRSRPKLSPRSASHFSLLVFSPILTFAACSLSKNRLAIGLGYLAPD